jgi:hypothetical protein
LVALRLSGVNVSLKRNPEVERKTIMKKKIIRSGLMLACALLTTAVYMTATAQAAKCSSAKWDVATIMAVKAHPPAQGEDANTIQYDVTVRVGNAEYIVLYVLPDGIDKELVLNRLGIDGLVLVGKDTIKYNDDLGNTHEVPIISRRAIAAKGHAQAR